jgi:hypothetical protein
MTYTDESNAPYGGWSPLACTRYNLLVYQYGYSQCTYSRGRDNKGETVLLRGDRKGRRTAASQNEQVVWCVYALVHARIRQGSGVVKYSDDHRPYDFQL